ncbi:AAA family ATPase protein [Rutstroemia sp. NJR-2017a BVV2]|nr:AAA family ATPase protein [Rutstroemia sp. NJR-2017a BVV2]
MKNNSKRAGGEPAKGNDEKRSIKEEIASENEWKRPTQEEQLAYLTQIDDPATGSDGEDCELHIYENRTDTRDEEVVLRVGTKSKVNAPKQKSHRACLVLTRYYWEDCGSSPVFIDLEIQSRYIVEALRTVIGTYHNIDFTSKTVTIREPPMCLFHYRDELHQYAEASNNEQLKAHIQLCLQYTRTVLHQEIKIFDSFISSSSQSPELEHRHLWMVYKPGLLVYEKIEGIEMLSRVRSIANFDTGDTKENAWIISTERICYVGNKIGFTKHSIRVSNYKGRRQVCDIPAIPLHFHPEEERIRFDLLKRGHQYISLFGVNHCSYDGAAQMCSRDSIPTPKFVTHTHNHVLLTRRSGSKRIQIKRRIMLDPEQYGRDVRQSGCNVFVLGKDTYSSAEEARQRFSDEDSLTCHHSIPGFSLEARTWGMFLVSNIKEVVYNDDAFHNLVLAEEKKRLISSLVQQQSSHEGDGYDDLIQGKGKGIIFLLHGCPGSGKTYTAVTLAEMVLESIADHRRRPLLKITSGELGANNHLVEERLMQLFSLAERWNAIILLDEADVFMQQRSVDNLLGNWLVSTLLRVLEYYEGILFLTTNRVETIDHAFRSRIHLSIAYPPLSADARRQLWRSTITRANRGQAPEWLTTGFLDHYEKVAINGREIRNLVRTGVALARSEKRDLESIDLMQGLEAWKRFETDFAELSRSRWNNERSRQYQYVVGTVLSSPQV